MRNQETPGVTGKFDLGVQNEAGQRIIGFCQENALVIANTLFQQHKRRLYTWTSPDGQHQNQIDYIRCSQNGEALCSQQKQDQELIMAQSMNSFLPNSDLNWRKCRKPLGLKPRVKKKQKEMWRCPFHHGVLECKIGSQRISGVTGKFGLGVQNE